MVRTGFQLILDAQPDIEVIAEVADGAACVEVARRLRPDVCLVDIRMPKLDGLDVTRALAGPDAVDPLRVVVVTTFDQDDYVYGALQGGACGFLLKDAGPGLLVEAVRAAARGDALVSPSVTVRLLERLGPHPGADGTGATDDAGRPQRSQGFQGAYEPQGPLTEREMDVARLVARGRTNQEICQELYVSLGTVKTHLGSIQTKLGVRNRVEIAAWAWETGAVRSR
ncbi:response regulator [Streptomyces sp. NPDC057743]|uniref:response regulator n=1 Tax=Streptomyces sp. NPDC057743 TaxID=3346236 RepID=UPI0036B48DBC